MKIMNYIYAVKDKKIILWYNISSGELEFRFDKNIGFPEDLKQAIKLNKNEVKEILAYNGICDEETAQKIKYYQIPNSLRNTELSEIQKGIYLQSILDGNVAAYNIPIFLKILSPKIFELEQAVLLTLEKNQILRMVVTENLCYKILPAKNFKISKIRINPEEVSSYLDYKSQQIFHIDGGQLITPEIIVIEGSNEVILNLSCHHILIDAYSIRLLVKKVFNSYNQILVKNSEPEQNNVNYFDYIAYQEYELTTLKYQKAIKNLAAKLNFISPIQLNKNKNYSMENLASSFDFILETNVVNQLNILTNKHNVSVYSVLATILYHVLSIYNQTNEIFSLALTVSNRPYDLNDVIGVFINTLPLIFGYNRAESLLANIIKANNEIIYLGEHKQMNLNILAHESKKSTIDIIELMHVMFTMHNFKTNTVSDENYTNVKVDFLEIPDHTEKFGISILAQYTDIGIKFQVNYIAKLYTREYITQIFSSYMLILNKLNEDSINESISNLNILSANDYQKIIYDWNKTEKVYPSTKTIHELFEKQVEQTPNKIAVVYEDTKLTYQELNQRSNQLAYYLRTTYKVKGDDLIALCLDRSEQILIVILATLKSGAAYVPMDPNYPDERIGYVLEDTRAKVVLTNEVYQIKLQKIINNLNNIADNLSTNESTIFAISDINFQVLETSAIIPMKAASHRANLQCKICLIDEIKFNAQLKKESSTNLQSTITSKNLAYVIYTSGTTGKPKGVMIEHNSATNTILGMKKVYINSSGGITKVTWFTNYVFDVSVSEIFTPLCSGQELHILSDELRQNTILLEIYLIKQRINCIYLPPIVLSSLAHKRSYPDLRVIIYAGEACAKEVAFRWLNKVRLYNYYGPTESSIYALGLQIKHGEVEQIGKPIPNVGVYVLANNLNPLPIGAVGELYIGGAGLARGYLNQEKLTAEKFILNPFQSAEEKKQKKNERLYKTGDVARYLLDGNIEYLGRNDFQVKIRGFRIELGEIESTLSSYRGIKQAVVVVQEHLVQNTDGQQQNASGENKYLIGYYVAEKKLFAEKILKYLATLLPEYMVPSLLVWLEKLPLTINGKLDRSALSNPEFISKDTYIAPRNDIEEEICSLYAEVLGSPLAKVGVRDNFFRLGGNSILAIKLSYRMSKVLNMYVAVAEIFKYKTVELLLEHINREKMAQVVIPAVNLDKYPLSFAQERLWFIEQYEGGTNAYHIPLLLTLDQNINLLALKGAIQAIVVRHEVLRSVFRQDDNVVGHQVVLDTALEIKEYTFSNKKKLYEQINNNINQKFDLNNNYPIRVCIYKFVKNIKDNHAESLKANSLSQNKLMKNATKPLFSMKASIKDQPELSVKKEMYLLINMHHVVSDGWSLEILQRELMEFYHYYSNGVKAKLPQLDIQYKDFAVWQRGYLSGGRLNSQLSYWKNKLSGYQTLNLATDKKRPREVDYAGNDVYFEIDERLSAGLRHISQDHGVTLYALLLTGFYILLNKYTSQVDITVGTPIANRNYAQLQNLIGFFVNSLVLREEFTPEMTAEELLQQIDNDLIEAQRNQDLPFEKLVEELKIEKDMSRNPIFQVMFSMQNFGNSNLVSQIWFQTVNLNINYKIAKYDLSLFIDDGKQQLSAVVNYRTSLYNKDTIERLATHYKYVLKQLSKNLGEKKLKDYSLFAPEEYKKIIYEWNKTEKSYPDNKTIHQLFEEQVKKTPDNIAIVYEEIKLTYQELNHRSNQLANYLRRTYKIGEDDLIALCLYRSEFILIAILAVLKAGGAYVPIAPSYPGERIRYILEDTKAKVVLINEVYKEKLSYIIKNSNGSICNVCLIDEIEFQVKLKQEGSTNLKQKITSQNLAYVIYTSGTTGNPKGVMLQHQGVVNRITWMNKEYPLKEQDCVLQKTPYVFDVSVWELLWANWCGASIVFAKDDGHKDTDYLIELISKNKITIMHFVPSMLDIFNQALENKGNYNLDNLRYIFCSGEALQLSQVKANQKLLPRVALHNLYGPTEVSIDVLHYPCLDRNLENIYIGKPIANTIAYVLDNALTPLPIGAIGELYVGGAGLARGYLNRPELSAERFIANPFQSKSEKRQSKNSCIYKTGDLVRYLPDGNIEYIGRNDFQVKIRGYRIELGEIENKLSSYPGISQVVVLAKEHAFSSDDSADNVSKRTFAQTGTKYLVGYYVSKDKLEEDGIIKYLSDILPEYMVPNVLVRLEKLPLTLNGKLDRKALPDPEFTNRDTYVMPRNELETKVCEIYASVLGLAVDKIGVFDDFFRLGGDSISSIQLTGRLRQRLNLIVSVKDIFNYKTIDKLVEEVLSKQVVNGDNAVNVLHEDGILSGNVELLPIQKWFFANKARGLYPNSGHWNQSFLIKVGALDKEVLEEALEKLISYHDNFRLNYKYDKKNKEYTQYYNAKKAKVAIKYLDLSKFDNVDEKAINASTVDEKITQKVNKNLRKKPNQRANREVTEETKLLETLTKWQSMFDLDKALPLYSIGYISGYRDGSCRLYFALHHLVVDVVSWRIICHDLEMIYNKLIRIKEEKQDGVKVEEILGHKGTSYRQWVNVVKAYQANREEGAYWDKAISGIKDYQTKLEQQLINGVGVSSARISSRAGFKLDKKTTELLLTKSNTAYYTEINDILLTAFAYALFKTTGEKSNYISLEGHGREEIGDNVDINRTVGWFTTMYPVKLVVEEEIGKTLATTKDNLRKIANKGIGYGVFYGYENLPLISFNYLGQLTDENEDQIEFLAARSNELMVGEARKELQQSISKVATETRIKWHIVGENSGESVATENVDRNIINANGLIVNNELQFSISSKLSLEMLDDLVKEFKLKLEAIINFTSNLKRKYLTRSDVNYIIEEEYLAKLQKSQEILGVYLANSLQQGFIYHALTEREDTSYRIQLVFDYANELEETLLHKAWNGAIKKYPGLRLRFAWEDEVVQIINKEAQIDWSYTDLSEESKMEENKAISGKQRSGKSEKVESTSAQTERIDKIINADRNRGYNLVEGNLLRVHLIKLDTAKYSCIISSHHAILDGWSNNWLLGYVHELYLKLEKNKTQPKNQEKLLTNIQEEIAYISSQKYIQEHVKEAKEYWHTELARIDEQIDLSGLLNVDKRHEDLYNYKRIAKRQEQQIEVSNQDYVELKQSSQMYGITINAVLQYAWHKLLSIYGNNKTTVVGTTIAGRSLPIDGIEESVGLYINTLPLIIEHKQELSIVEELNLLQEKITGLNTHSGVSLTGLQQDGQRLFANLFVYENYPVGASKENSKIKLKFNKVIEELDYPLAIIANERDGSIIINLKYAGELFTKETINKLLDTLQIIIKSVTSNIIANKKARTKELSYLSAKEYKKIVYTWNKTEKSYSQNKTINQLFEEQVAKTPNNVAVVYEETKLTYLELNQRSNQLGNYLRRSYEIKGDDLIVLCLDRSEYTLIAILATLKSGAAYVPIDPSYPDERIKYILEDTRAKVILTNKIYQEVLQKILNKTNFNSSNHNVPNNVTTMTAISVKVEIHGHNVECDLCLIDENKFQAKLKKESKKNPIPNITNSNLAYVIYTSGTTGNPKGVMVEHSGIINLIYDLSKRYSLSENEVILQLSNYIFDASVEQMMLALLNGHRLLIVNNSFWGNLPAFYSYLKGNKITHIHATPFILEQFNFQSINSSIKRIISGGDMLTNSAYAKIKNNSNEGTLLINEYGPTETAITSIVNVGNENNAIGIPISNVTVYVLNYSLYPVPIGAIGELYIGGVGLARGYLNRPDLTAERFIVNPFQTEAEKKQGKNARLYKTGDLVRYLPDGNLEYIGRNDFQVKIRGFRIELGEIESTLSGYKEIAQAVVLAKEHMSGDEGTDIAADKIDSNETGNKYLIGYYVAAKKLDEEAILKYLADKLPEYMVPNVLMWLEKLPLTINGKLDRKALPAPIFTNKDTYIAPRNEVERQLCNIFATVLGIEVSSVGINDDFFKLGGNSISAIKLFTKLNNLGYNIRVSDLFANRNIKKILTFVSANCYTENSCVILMSANLQIQKNTTFLLHGVGGGVLSYIDIVKNIAEDQNLFGIQSRGIDNEEDLFHNYDEMLKEYTVAVSTILAKNGQQKFNIIGWSYGVNIALDLINLLYEMGYLCQNIILIDGNYLDTRSMRNLVQFESGTTRAEKLKALLEYYKKNMGVKYDANGSEKYLTELVYNLYGYPKTSDYQVMVKNILIALNNLELLSSKTKFYNKFNAKQFSIIKASQTKHFNITKLCKKMPDDVECDYVEIPGDHWSIMKDEKLIRYIRQKLLYL